MNYWAFFWLLIGAGFLANALISRIKDEEFAPFGSLLAGAFICAAALEAMFS